MLKIEYIWKDLLDRTIEKNNPEFTITELANKYSLSTSVVNHALIPIRELNIIKVSKTSSQVIDWERLLFFWATRRNLKKDIVYSTYSNLPVFKREGLMPADVTPTAYTAFRLLFKRVPSDYDRVYFYSNNPNNVIKRFPKKEGSPNIFILTSNKSLVTSNQLQISLSQLFVDLWNLPEWYAKDFQEATLLEIKKRLKQ
ncbi:hypothetical protein A2954_02565 [Candidatus Roizmanbacteria bacterium RIFCSPLOWO2_01_FULL_37_12]|uniref:Helix-turn-helix type 11 domain-containing protein n=1 Tax=Candidatus Roizmanbacteria bacterium RIFCSPLOWO2_01_FULL_37_12 TaxID=1802056 RepID=A0A1F7IEX6_9BACT|nr:MAG: hypothetical protein A3D76_02025 [Candidatus Roizmanbacteria bacterium RIFCSPHIGHO2_02_FULL_37_9b]OGK41909.1 MAG: hypothetical protein A2954_02565 [Candidatus Roizmanbacteria bacterium RIFCSPLOWO2_01_FULL_37_12]